MNRFIKNLLIAIFLLSIGSCSIVRTNVKMTDRNRSHATSDADSEFNNNTSDREMKLTINPKMYKNELKIDKIILKEGQISLRILDPEGNIVEERTFTAPSKLKETFDLQIIPGTWRLELELKDATGNYDIFWEARG